METLVSGLLESYKNFIDENDLYNMVQQGRAYGVGPGERVEVKPGFLYFLQSGFVSAELIDVTEVRSSDGYNFYSHIYEGMILGVIEKCCPNIKIDYVTQSYVDLIKISYEDFELALQDGKSDVTSLFRLMSYMIAFLTCNTIESSTAASYSTIRAMIYRYGQKKDLNVLGGEMLSHFIMKRTNLSRSYVFKVISDLKKGGYITVKSGKLISINKNIPADY